MPNDVLVKLGSKIELFHTPAGTAFADVLIDGHRETWAVQQQADAGLAATSPLRGDWGDPAHCRRFVQRSICSRPAPNSILPSKRSTSASLSKPAASFFYSARPNASPLAACIVPASPGTTENERANGQHAHHKAKPGPHGIIKPCGIYRPINRPDRGPDSAL
jgi:hypothetical protein